MEVKFKTCQGIEKYDATEMTKEEFKKIMWEEDTPQYVIISETEAYNNTYTCSGGYAGTCNCMSHPQKEWIRFNPTTGAREKTLSI